MPAFQSVLCVGEYDVMNPPKLRPSSSTREPSMYGCEVSHFSPSSRSFSSCSPTCLYDVQAGSTPLPLALRLSHTHTTMPWLAMSWYHPHCRAAQRLATCGACGPE